jgi:glycosyltransferase involved in cell wall biosynthesis
MVLMQPDVSVVIPVHERLTGLDLAIESVLSQTVPVREVIVVDDGSRKEIGEAIQQLISKHAAWNGRVRYARQEKRGQSAARNTGINLACSEWVAFNDSDDLWLPQKLEWQFRALQEAQSDCGFCFTDAWFMNNPQMKMTLFQLAGTQYEARFGVVEDSVRFVRHILQTWVQTAVARTEIARQVMFDEELRYQEDLDFVFRMAAVTRICYVNMPMVLIDRSPAEGRHEGASRDWHREEFRLRMNQYRHEKNLKQSESLEPGIKALIRSSLREVHSSWANRHLRFGEYREARHAITEATRYELTPGIALKWLLTMCAPFAIRKGLIMRERKDATDTRLDPLR